ncbi:hypothetical protein E3V36_05295 [Candidatus Marinimicrobia bacterium MT.SAG.2]|nr:hypothetical protein E3V36_05295 [Candidatus Marinimicrobia bacterium MT.SAG.2]
METTRATSEETEQAWQILTSTGAYREGHFEFDKTGFHYDKFFQLPLAYQYTKNARILSVTLSRMIRRSGILARFQEGKTFTIVTPSDVGIPIAFWAGEVLDADRILWMPKFEGERTFHQFVELSDQDQVMIVTDIMFSGEQVKNAYEKIKSTGASVVLITSIVDRRKEVHDYDGVLVMPLLKVNSERHSPEECPMCKEGIELTKVQLG